MDWWSSVVSQGKEVASQRETAQSHPDEPRECRITISPGCCIWGFFYEYELTRLHIQRSHPSKCRTDLLFVFRGLADFYFQTCVKGLTISPPSKSLLYCILKWNGVTQTERYIQYSQLPQVNRQERQDRPACALAVMRRFPEIPGDPAKLTGGLAAQVPSESHHKGHTHRKTQNTPIWS